MSGNYVSKLGVTSGRFDRSFRRAPELRFMVAFMQPSHRERNARESVAFKCVLASGCQKSGLPFSHFSNRPN